MPPSLISPEFPIMNPVAVGQIHLVLGNHWPPCANDTYAPTPVGRQHLSGLSRLDVRAGASWFGLPTPLDRP